MVGSFIGVLIRDGSRFGEVATSGVVLVTTRCRRDL